MESIRLCVIFLLKWGVVHTTTQSTELVSGSLQSTKVTSSASFTGKFPPTNDSETSVNISETSSKYNSVSTIIATMSSTINTGNDSTTMSGMMTSETTEISSTTSNETTMTYLNTTEGVSSSVVNTTTSNSTASPLGLMDTSEALSPEQVGIIVGSASGLLVIVLVIIVACIRLRSRPKSLSDEQRRTESGVYTGQTSVSEEKGEKHEEANLQIKSDGNDNYHNIDETNFLKNRQDSKRNNLSKPEEKETNSLLKNGDIKPASESESKKETMSSSTNGNKQPESSIKATSNKNETPLTPEIGGRIPIFKSESEEKINSLPKNGDIKPALKSESKKETMSSSKNGDKKPASKTDSKKETISSSKNGDKKPASKSESKKQTILMPENGETKPVSDQKSNSDVKETVPMPKNSAINPVSKHKIELKEEAVQIPENNARKPMSKNTISNYQEIDEEIFLMNRRNSKWNEKPKPEESKTKSLLKNSDSKPVITHISSNYQEVDEELFLGNRQEFPGKRSVKSKQEGKEAKSFPEHGVTKHIPNNTSTNYQEVDEEILLKNRELSLKSKSEDKDAKPQLENESLNTVSESKLAEEGKNSIKLNQTRTDNCSAEKNDTADSEPIYAQPIKKKSRKKQAISMNSEAVKNLLDECEKYMEDIYSSEEEIDGDDVYTNGFSLKESDEKDNDIYEDAESLNDEGNNSKDKLIPKSDSRKREVEVDDHYEVTEFDNPEDDDDIYDNKEVEYSEPVKDNNEYDDTYDCAMNSLAHDKGSDIYDSTKESDYDLTEHESGKRRFIIASRDENYDHCVLPEEREDYDMVVLPEENK